MIKALVLGCSTRRPVWALALMYTTMFGGLLAQSMSSLAAPVDLKTALAAAVDGNPLPVPHAVAGSANCGGRRSSVAGGQSNAPLKAASLVVAAATSGDTIFANGYDNSGGECLTLDDCPVPPECFSLACTEGLCTTVPLGVSGDNCINDADCCSGICDPTTHTCN